MTPTHLSEEAQHMLARLWAAEEEGQEGLEVAPPPPDAVKELLEHGYATYDPPLLRLTDAGRPEARLAVRRRRLAERLLADVLATEEDALTERACRLEHALMDGIDDSICTLLGHPRFCPHGRPIPPGPCCEEMRETVSRLIAPLSHLHPGQSGVIAYIQMKNPNRLQKLMAMGVLPGERITLLRRMPSYVFQVGFSQFAVDEEIASDIYVRLTNEETSTRSPSAS